MIRSLILFSHTLTASQRDELSLRAGGETEFLALPDELQRRFSQVPPGPGLDLQLLEDLDAWLDRNGRPGDQAVVQGDWGVTVYLVDRCRLRGIHPLYATTRREASETRRGEEVVLQHVFRHAGFREYPAFPGALASAGGGCCA